MGNPHDEEIDDIEDLGETPEVSRIAQLKASGPVPKVTRKNVAGPEIVADSIIPGTQNVYVKTWGCAHNSSDSEYMAGLLNENGYNITDDASLADIWLLNSCTVKNPAEDHFRNAIDEGRKKGKYVVVAGCVSQAAPKTPYMEGLSMIGVQQIDRVVEVVEETLKGNSVRLLGTKKVSGKKQGGASLQLPKVRRNELIEIIPINTGWYQIRNLIPSKNRNICGPSVIWSTNESMVKRPIIDVELKFGEEGIGPGIVLVS
ncbi:Threonylcarbamoyladenosine tRNA methylthiotransferase [Araneus ventricosus]|uniref:Threonylcarbamoyladenosine tRNA methylthiotransferase n=1 Tax=Araneus ventricosus TaxID=182803 RepID=A0A4Y2IHE2_ARAVE|nr:Threonylcarbamoyladenosine tRNA methylthiotransferase [Araneus ventricosus]